MRPKQFTTLYLSAGLYKKPFRTGLDLCRKICIKILYVIMSKLVFRLYRIELLTNKATPSPRQVYFKFTAQNRAVKFSFALREITVAFASLTM